MKVDSQVIIPNPMNTQNIEVIFLDLGNTMRILIKDEQHMAQARQKIVELAGTDDDPLAFCAMLEDRYKAYRKWALESLVEAPEAELWTRWLVPEFPAERIVPVSGELTYQFRQSMGKRILVEGAKEVVNELNRRGYILGIISNLIGKREIPEWLESEGFTPYFKSVVLSSMYGKRKPDPSIFTEAARIAGAEPENCVYVGDNLKRDVVGARQAGFGMVIILISPQNLAEAVITDENHPDLIIHKFDELLNLFPDRSITDL